MKESIKNLKEMTKQDLLQELSTWSREEIIGWLCLNDPYGIYKDEDSLNELGNVMLKDEGIEIILKQVERCRNSQQHRVCFNFQGKTYFVNHHV